MRGSTMPLLKTLLKLSNNHTANRIGKLVMVVLRNGEWIIGTVIHENRYYLHLRVGGNYVPIFKKTIKRVMPYGLY